MTDPLAHLPQHVRDGLVRATRRQFLGRVSLGLGAASLTQWMPGLAHAGLLGTDDGLPGPHPAPHWAPKAKRVIFLCMAGGPSHLETFDPKPRLGELDGQPMPE